MNDMRKDAVVRSRSAGVGDGKSGLETAMLFAIRASGLPEPAREWHFDWCCEHPKADHSATAGWEHDWCHGCYLAADGVAFDHPFCRGRAWRFDFAWPALKIALEVDGGTHSGGRHTRGMGYDADCEKANEAAIAGWTVLRVTGAMVSSGAALDYLERLLKEEAH